MNATLTRHNASGSGWQSACPRPEPCVQEMRKAGCCPSSRQSRKPASSQARPPHPRATRSCEPGRCKARWLRTMAGLRQIRSLSMRCSPHPKPWRCGGLDASAPRVDTPVALRGERCPLAGVRGSVLACRPSSQVVPMSERRFYRLLLLLLAWSWTVLPAQAQLRGHGGPVRALALSADGTQLASASFDATAIIWSLGTGTAEKVLRFHDGALNAVAWLGSERIATGGEDARIAIWQRGQDQPVTVLLGHSAPDRGARPLPRRQDAGFSQLGQYGAPLAVGRGRSADAGRAPPARQRGRLHQGRRRRRHRQLRSDFANLAAHRHGRRQDHHFARAFECCRGGRGRQSYCRWRHR